MIAIVIIAIVAVLIFIGYDGYKTWEYSEEKFKYNFFSLKNIGLIILIYLCIVAGVIAGLGKGEFDIGLNTIVFWFVAVAIFGYLLRKNILNTNLRLGIRESFYQLVVVVLFILITLFVGAKNSGKR
jgi:hypothetical protein